MHKKTGDPDDLNDEDYGATTMHVIYLQASNSVDN